jgi:hypothetical protein
MSTKIQVLQLPTWIIIKQYHGSKTSNINYNVLQGFRSHPTIYNKTHVYI